MEEVYGDKCRSKSEFRLVVREPYASRQIELGIDKPRPVWGWCVLGGYLFHCLNPDLQGSRDYYLYLDLQDSTYLWPRDVCVSEAEKTNQFQN